MKKLVSLLLSLMLLFQLSLVSFACEGEIPKTTAEQSSSEKTERTEKNEKANTTKQNSTKNNVNAEKNTATTQSSTKESGNTEQNNTVKNNPKSNFGYSVACADAAKIGINKTTTHLGAVELETEKIVLETNSDKLFEMTGLPVALMVAYVASQNFSGLTMTVTGECIVDRKNNVLGLSEGMNVNLNDLIAATVLYNDVNAMNTIALGVSGSAKDFLKLMNKTASSLQMKSTYYVNYTGAYNKLQMTCIGDLLSLMYAVYKSSSIADVTSSPVYYIRTNEIYGKIKTLANPFKMVNSESEEYKEEIYGFGTFSDSSGIATTMLLAESENERYLVAMRTAEPKKVYSDASTVVDYIYKNFILADITKVIQEIGNTVALNIGGENVQMTVSKGKYKNIYLVVNSFYSRSAYSINEYSVENPTSLPNRVKVGDEIKNFTVKFNDTVVAVIDMTVKSVGEEITTKKELHFSVYSSDKPHERTQTFGDRIWIPLIIAVAVAAIGILFIIERKK